MNVGRVRLAALVVGCASLVGCGDEPEAPSGGPAPFRLPADVGPGAGYQTSPTADPFKQADEYIAKVAIDRAAPGWKTRLPVPPELTWPTDKKVVWVLDTNKGRMAAELFPQSAPRHAANVVYLSRLGFYDGLIFHRVIKGFMAQGGCPLGNGGGTPGYALPLEARASVRHDRRGILSAARTNNPNSANSQFFLTFGPAPGLDVGPRNPGYSVFGALVEGADTSLAAIEAAGAPGDPGTPSERLVIEKTHVELR